MFTLDQIRRLRDAAAGVVHTYASARREGEEWETAGRRYKRINGRTIRLNKAGEVPKPKTYKRREITDDRTVLQRIGDGITDAGAAALGIVKAGLGIP